MCWSCGKQRSENDVPVNVSDEDPAEPSDDSGAPLGSLIDENALDNAQLINSDNPYQPPSMVDSENGPSKSETPEKQHNREVDDGIEKEVSRILTGAVIAFFLFPVSIYMTYRLVNRIPFHAYRVPRLRGKLILAWVLIVISFAIGIATFGMGGLALVI